MLIILIALLLCLRANLHIIYDKDLCVYVKVLFIKYTIYPAKRKKFNNKKYEKKKSKEKEIKQPVLKSAEEKEKKGSLLDKILYVKEILSVLIKTFANHLRINIAQLHIKVASPDAAQTAIMYGAISGAVAGIIEIIDSYSNIKYQETNSVTVDADFLSEKCEASINISLSISVYGAIITLAKTFWKSITLKNKQ